MLLKLNMSNPQAGTQKTIEFDDINKRRIFFEKALGQEVQLDAIGPEFKGYVFKISGGNDNDGFPMKQGVKTNTRVRLLLKTGHSCYRPKRTGERKRKSVRGCIIGEDIRVIALVLVKKGEQNIEGLTDTYKAKRLGPKRASKIRKLFGFKKTDSKELIKKNVIRRTFKTAAGKDRVKAPKVQRLITDARIKRKAQLKKLKKERGAASEKAAENYQQIIDDFRKAKRAAEPKEKKEAKPATTSVPSKPKEVKAKPAATAPATTPATTPAVTAAKDKKKK